MSVVSFCREPDASDANAPPCSRFATPRSSAHIRNLRARRDVVGWERWRNSSRWLEDVEHAIVVYTRERNRREALVAAAASNQRAVDLATALYTRGLNAFLNVLDAQRNLFQTQSDLAQSETTVSTDFVALHKGARRWPGCL